METAFQVMPACLLKKHSLFRFSARRLSLSLRCLRTALGFGKRWRRHFDLLLFVSAAHQSTRLTPYSLNMFLNDRLGPLPLVDDRVFNEGFGTVFFSEICGTDLEAKRKKEHRRVTALQQRG